MKQGCEGVDYGGKPHVLDTMEILDSIWSRNNRYAREDGIQRCWRKAEILPEDWQNQLKEQLGSISMIVKDKNKLSKEICDDFCNIMKTISTKATQIDISKEGHGLSGSFVNEDLTQEETEEAINNWIEIEDDEDIQNAEMEEEMKRLEQSSKEDEKDVEPEEEDPSLE